METTGQTSGPAAGQSVPGHGGPRSAATRRAILDAARSAFAAQGYDRSTIRSIAAAAGVDASMVMRYFDSKAGLFAAVATADMPVLQLAPLPAARRGEALVRHLIERWEAPASGDELMLLLRTAVTSEDVAAKLQDVLAQLIIGPIAATGAKDAEVRGALIQSQLLGTVLCRYILRQEPLASLSVEDVIASIAPSVQRYLDAPDVTATYSAVSS
ncbi:TetR/AcrR family transcriptional regulator [Actinospica robiniae]|uniref:TetR/AcrR family transcriptional regulator n=1 Tax=Actinospica robiniae TaxID=304901 RepID=UPI000423B712|nr:TetR family transcriptional regulator [Actinospica robiniae]